MNLAEVQSLKDAGFTHDEVVNHVAKTDPEAAALLAAGFRPDEIEQHRAKNMPKQTPVKEDAGLLKQGAAIAANIAISEGSKVAGTAAGAAAGGAVSAPTLGAAAPATVPIGAGIGYVSGALAGGWAGSAAEQEILGEPFSYGKAAANALLNVIPGGVGKWSKGGRLVRKAVEVAAKHPVATSTLAGAALAPAGVAIEGLIDKGEVPDAKELAATSLTSAVLGAGLGKTQETGAKLLAKFAKKPAHEIDDLVRRGDRMAVSYVDAVTPDDPNVGFMKPGEVKEYLNELFNVAKARSAPSLVTGKEVAQSVVKARSIANAGRETGSILNKKITKFINDSPHPDDTSDTVMDFLTGKINAVPPELSSITDDILLARQSIKEYQQELLRLDDVGQRKLPKELRAKIEESMNNGDYVTQEYRFFVDPKFEPSERARLRLHERLVNDGMDPKKAEEYIAGLNQSKAGTPDDLASYIASANAGILKAKSDVTPELEAYLGVIRDPGEYVEGTMSKLSRLVAYDASDNEIKNVMLATVARKAGEGVDDPDYVPLMLRRGQAMDGDEKIFVPRHTQQAINSLYAVKGDDDTQDLAASVISDIFKSTTALSKGMKVLANPPSYLVQLYGNVAGLAQQGKLPFRSGKKGAMAAASQFESAATRLGAKDLATIKRYKELNLLGESVAASDIRQGLKGTKVGDVITAPLAPLGKVYSIPDIALRVDLFEGNKAFLLKVAPSASADPAKLRKLEEIAAEMTNDTYPNYDYINKGLKTLSQHGISSQFAAFSFELARNNWNQGKLIKAMMSGKFADRIESELGVVNRKRIMAEGSKRFATMAGVYGATAGAIWGWNTNKSNLSQREQQAIDESVVPEWDKDQPNVYHRDKDGSIRWMKSSYILPQAQVLSPLMAGIEEQDFASAMTKSLSVLGNDVLGEGNFVLNALIPAIQNYDPKAKEKISKSTDPARSAVQRTEWAAKEMFTPGLSREIEKAKKQPVKDTAMRQLGIRVNKTSIDEAARFKFKDVKTSLNALQAEYGYQRSKTTGDELQAERARLNKDYVDNQLALQKHVQNYRVLGKTDEELLKMMRENGISAEKALAAIEGMTIDLPETGRKTITERYEELLASGKPIRDEIAGMRQSDPYTAKALMEKHRQVEQDNRKNLSEMDRAVRMLSVEDGTRARYITRKMQASTNPEMVLRDYMKKGLIDQRTMEQIRSLNQ